MTIDTNAAIIYGATGSASYCINDSGGIELTDELDGGITDAEYLANDLRNIIKSA